MPTPCEGPRPTLRLTLLLSSSNTPQAGADALFEDPDRRSTSLGVTVNPVRVPDIAGFGTLQVADAVNCVVLRFGAFDTLQPVTPSSL